MNNYGLFFLTNIAIGWANQSRKTNWKSRLVTLVFVILLFVKTPTDSNIFFCSGYVSVLIGWANCSSLPFIRGVGVRLFGREKRVGREVVLLGRNEK